MVVEFLPGTGFLMACGQSKRRMGENNGGKLVRKTIDFCAQIKCDMRDIHLKYFVRVGGKQTVEIRNVRRQRGRLNGPTYCELKNVVSSSQ
jgi:hypothetical protein